MKDPEEKERFFQVCAFELMFYTVEAVLTTTESIVQYAVVVGYLSIELCGYLFQDVFPTDFGPEYDSALQMLMLDFLSRLEKLLPVPDIQQVLEPVWKTNHFVISQAPLVLLAASSILDIKGNLIAGWYVHKAITNVYWYSIHQTVNLFITFFATVMQFI